MNNIFNILFNKLLKRKRKIFAVTVVQDNDSSNFKSYLGESGNIEFQGTRVIWSRVKE